MTNSSRRRSAPAKKARTRPVPTPPADVQSSGPADASVRSGVRAEHVGRWLTWGVRILWIEAIVVGVVTLATIWVAIVGTNVSTASAVATPAFAALFAAIFAGLAVALARGKSLARGPAITLQILLLPVGYIMIGVGVLWLGVPTMILGLAGAAALLAPSTRAALGLR